MKKVEISIIKHEWLDCSVSWFIEIDGVKFGGEICSEQEAINNAKNLAEKMNAEFDENIHNSSEMFINF